MENDLKRKIIIHATLEFRLFDGGTAEQSFPNGSKQSMKEGEFK